jgi:hypothetical protein
VKLPLNIPRNEADEIVDIAVICSFVLNKGALELAHGTMFKKFTILREWEGFVQAHLLNRIAINPTTAW